MVWCDSRAGGEVSLTCQISLDSFDMLMALRREIATKMSQAPQSKTVLIDAFGGAGGNAIQFALSGRWRQIFVVEKDPAVLACAKHNAEIYGVAKMLWFINGDIFDVLSAQLKSVTSNAVIFGSPPWGGESPTNSHDNSR